MTPLRWKTIRTPGSSRTIVENASICSRVCAVKPDRDQRLNRAPERGKVDVGVKPADDSAAA